jgi:excisionase family DNA binding protein
MAGTLTPSRHGNALLSSTNHSEDDGMSDARIRIEKRDDVVNRWKHRIVSARAARSRSAERQPRPASERLRTVAEAADELGLSVYTVRAWIANRRIAHVRLGRTIRITAGEIRRVIEAGTVPAERT